MVSARPEDHFRYEKLLGETKDSEGVVHRDLAIKLLVEDLLAEEARTAEFAEAHAQKIADRFDQSHKPETESGQMRLMEDDYLILGDNERVRVTEAMAHHTRQWLDIGAENHARQAAAWAAKDLHGRRLLRIQEERNCSMFEAQESLAS
jgi:hypothetical protein